MTLTIVVAASENNVIGINNNLPWHLPDDLKFFKKITLGKPVIMGRKTFESLGRPLPNRLNIVLSRSQQSLPEGVIQFRNYEAAIAYIQTQNCEELCVIGGGVLFAELINSVDQIFLTRVHTILANGEVFFPTIDQNIWEKVWEEHHPEDDKHAISFSFQRYTKIPTN
ncbi:MAG: dihydrofolate reductase [Chitinophagaceae bacterium]|nr:dihydrofolate reductase [Chitinophagaceae bacterium]